MKNIYKYILSTLMLVALAIGNVWAADVMLTIDATSVSSGGVSVTCEKDSGSSDPAVQVNSYVRLYAKNTVTISCSTKKIVALRIGWSKNTKKDYASASADCGSYTDPAESGSTVVYGEWTGSANTIVFTIGSSGQKQIHSVEVTFEGSSSTVSVTGVSLNKNTTSLMVGATETLVATVSPDNATNKNVNWSSSNSSVASVDNTGKVTAVAAGTATITVTTADGSKTATCTVTVSAASATYTATYQMPTCVTSPANGSTTTTKYASSVSPAISGYTFVGWTNNSSYEDGATKPSAFYNPNDNVAATESVLPVFSYSDGSVSKTTFTIINSEIVSGQWYVISNGQSGDQQQYVLGNNLSSQNQIDGIQSNATSNKNSMTVNTSSAIYYIEGNSTTGYTMKSFATGKYLTLLTSGGSVTNNKLAFVDSPDSYSYWDIYVWNSSSYTYHIKNHGDTSFQLKYYGTNKVWYGSNSTESVKYIFNVDVEPGGSSITYTINPPCTTYSVTYDGNGKTGGSVPTDGTSYASGASVTVLGNTGSLTKTGYTFDGWNTKADGSGADYAAGSTFSITANTTLYAKWTPITYTVSYDANGGTGTTASSTHTYDVAKSLTSNGFSKSGYTFRGWATTSTGAKVYDDGASVKNLASTQGSTVTLYAVWEENAKTYIYFSSCGASEYTITYNKGNYSSATGSLPTTVTVSAGSSYTVSTASLSLTGYTWVGWNTDQNATTGLATIDNVNGNKPLYAIFTPNKHNVTYVLGTNGTGCDNQTNVAYGSEVTVCANPTREGYNFTGWTVTAGGVTITAGKFTMPDADVTLTANWAVKVVCAITWMVDGAAYTTGSPSTSAESGTAWRALTLPAAPADNTLADCERTVFVGWTASGTISGDGQSAPSDLFKTASDANASSHTITGVTTFHAVFAKVASLGTVVLSEEFDNNSTSDATTAIDDKDFANFSGSTSRAYKSKFGGIKFGSSSAVGYITSKSLDLSQAFSVSLKVKGYTTGGGTITVSAGSTTKTYTYSAGPNDADETATLDFPAASSSSTVKISSNASAYRAYIDDVVIYTGGATYSDYVTECAGIEHYDVTLVVTGATGGSAKLAGTLTATPGVNQTKNITNVASTTISNVADVPGYSYTVTKTSGNATFTDNSDGTWTVANPSSDVTVTVTYTALPTYNISFNVGNGSGTFADLSTYNGGSVQIPASYTPTHTCGMFVGWAESEANGEKPGTIYKAGENYTLGSAAAKTLYAVYSVSSGCTQPFSLGTSGSTYTGTQSGTYYLLTASDTYATNWQESGKKPYSNSSSDIASNAGITKTTFKLTYVSSASTPSAGIYKFAIYVDATKYNDSSMQYSGYWTGTSDAFGLSSTPYYWTIAATAGGYSIKAENKYINASLNLGTSIIALNFEPADALSYYTNYSCSSSTVSATFETGGGTINWNSSSLWDSADDYTGLSKCTELTVFPTVTLPGWSFIGWMTSDYNVVNESGLDDEGASDVIPNGDAIYSTDGNHYTMGAGDVTFYPILTKYDDNDPIDLSTGGDYYMYFYASADKYKNDAYFSVDNHLVRMYASTTVDNYGFKYTYSCSNAQLFRFTAAPTEGWYIQRINVTTGNPLAKESYVEVDGNNLKFVTTPTGHWDITPSGQQYEMVFHDATLHSGNKMGARDDGFDMFKYYENTNYSNSSSLYHLPYLGSCENRVFSSHPGTPAEVELTGDVNVTSTAGQTVRGIKSLSLSATGGKKGEVVTVTSSSSVLLLSTTKDCNMKKAAKPTQTVTVAITNDDGSLDATPVYVHYCPTETADGIEEVVVKATYSSSKAEATVRCRHLRANGDGSTDGFVIVTKVGDQWLALPSVMSAGTQTGVPVVVDNDADPTYVTSAPLTTKYNMYNVYTSSGSADRYVARGEDVYFGSVTEQGLKTASGSTDISLDAYVPPTSPITSGEQYEWTLTTSDLKDYTLTNATRTAYSLKHANSSTKIGMYSDTEAGTNIFRLLPATFVVGECQIIEWSTNSVTVMYTGALTDVKVKIGKNGTGTAQNVVSKGLKKDHGVYCIPTPQTLTSTYAGKKMLLSFYNGSASVAAEFTIPIIVSASSTQVNDLGVAKERCAELDLVVLKGASVEAVEEEYAFQNVTVYGGGKLVVGSGYSLNLQSLNLRSGGGWSTGTYDYVYPQVCLTGDMTIANNKIYYDYITTKEQYYTFVLPFNAVQSTIQYPLDIYGSNVEVDNTGSFEFMKYNGQIRATGVSGWEAQGAADLMRGTGYTFLGMPKKVTVDGVKARQTFGMHRITIDLSYQSLADEKNAKTVDANAYPTQTGHVNDEGWNLVGNPFMANYRAATTATGVGKLLPEMVNGQWTGAYVYNGDKLRYVTLPSDDGQSYEQKKIADVDLPAFKNFFIQVGEPCQLNFDVANRAKNVLRKVAAASEELEFAIVLADSADQDETGLLIGEEYTAAYEMNADLAKWNRSGINLYTIGGTGNLAYMAINPTLAADTIPVGYIAPAAGQFSFSLGSTENISGIAAITLTDHDLSQTANLLVEDYTFSTAAGTFNQRFSLSVAFAPQSGTDLGETAGTSLQVWAVGEEGKFAVFGLPREGRVFVYDATGRLVAADDISASAARYAVPAGTYIIRVLSEEGNALVRTIVK